MYKKKLTVSSERRDMGLYEVPLSVFFVGFWDRDYVSQLSCVRYYVFVKSSFKHTREECESQEGLCVLGPWSKPHTHSPPTPPQAKHIHMSHTPPTPLTTLISSTSPVLDKRLNYVSTCTTHTRPHRNHTSHRPHTSIAGTLSQHTHRQHKQQ